MGNRFPYIKGEPEPGSYITDGMMLFEVIGVDGKRCVLENCSDGSRCSPEKGRLKSSPWGLVRPAPPVPDPWEVRGVEEAEV